MTTKVPSHFIVIVPGFMGSKLREPNSREMVWIEFPNFGNIISNVSKWGSWLNNKLNKLKYPNPLEPAGIMDKVLFLKPWAKLEVYSPLIEKLKGWGYQIDPTKSSDNRPAVYTFAYDWRQDNRISARQLDKAINGWGANHPDAKVWIIAHSNGGLVARWYIEKLGGKEHVGRLFLMASPWDGAPMAMQVLFSGLDTLFQKGLNKVFKIPQHTSELVRTFPSLYQLLPHHTLFLQDKNLSSFDIFTNSNWLENEHKEMLIDAKKFHEELGTTTSVKETVCFFGRKKCTPNLGRIEWGAGGGLSSIDWIKDKIGDGTVPERSAVFPNTHQQPVVAGHGDIYINSDVLEKLHWELVDKYGVPYRAELATDRLTVIFEPEHDLYSPGELINIWATIHENKEGSSPISGAKVEVQLEWCNSLPCSEAKEPPDNLPETRRLWESENEKGRYEGSLETPATEGYYRLKANIQVIGESRINLEELIAIENISELTD